MSTQASSFHRIVVEDVIKNIREDFINEGLDENVLEDLKQRWESKLGQIPHAYDHPNLPTHSSYTYDMNNYNYMDPNSTLLPLSQNPLYSMNPYLTPTTQRGVAHNTALNSLRTLHQPTTLPSTTTTSTYYDPTGKPQPYLAPPSGVQSWNTQPTLPTGLNTQYNPPNIRQQDGASDEADPMTEIQKNDAILLKKFAKVQKQQQKIEKIKSRMPKTDTTNSSSDTTSSVTIPQFDGLGDKKEKDEDDDDDEEEGSPKGDEELGSDLDDEDDQDEPDTDYIVLCQYEKVTRVKNKRKANLKDGIMHINGKDYVFSKATGEFDW
eukprot:Phypoly_transcript_11704.p1 GENE.Phypoly_transcript_11704~~Phypoly_transcript_11704.p1  ORF type:complete len:322 (+),score=68.43 Phypoly_transcript_11704:47-1012(+)